MAEHGHLQGNKYNIPINIWLTEEFPVEAPLVFVVPTQTMIIKENHPQVRYVPLFCGRSP